MPVYIIQMSTTTNRHPPPFSASSLTTTFSSRADTCKIENLGDALFLQEQRELIQAHMARTGGTYIAAMNTGEACHVCGIAST